MQTELSNREPAAAVIDRPCLICGERIGFRDFYGPDNNPVHTTCRERQHAEELRQAGKTSRFRMQRR